MGGQKQEKAETKERKGGWEQAIRDRDQEHREEREERERRTQREEWEAERLKTRAEDKRKQKEDIYIFTLSICVLEIFFTLFQNAKKFRNNPTLENLLKYIVS